MEDSPWDTIRAGGSANAGEEDLEVGVGELEIVADGLPARGILDEGLKERGLAGHRGFLFNRRLT
jgi:hypothetical protein